MKEYTNIVSVTPPTSRGGASVVEVNGREIADTLDIQCYEQPEGGIKVTLTFMAAQTNYAGINAVRDPAPPSGYISTPNAIPPSLWQRFKAWLSS